MQTPRVHYALHLHTHTHTYTRTRTRAVPVGVAGQLRNEWAAK